jgi:hypothetical protein
VAAPAFAQDKDDSPINVSLLNNINRNRQITGAGTLPDGRTFRLHVNEVLGELRVVEIDFF